MSADALLPVERPLALVRGALAAFGSAGPAALVATGTVVDATAAIPGTLTACTTAAIVVVISGALPWRVRLVGVCAAVAVTAAFSPTTALAALLGCSIAGLLERGAPSWSTTSRVLQWTTTALLGLSLFAGTVTMLLAAGGPWRPLALSGAAPLLAPSPVVDVVGLACVGFGLVTVGWCARFLIAGGGTPDPIAPPQAWCTSGPYATSSHPMQRGQLLVLLGVTLLLNTWGGAFAAAVLGVLLLGPVRRAEARQRDARQRDDGAPTI